MKWEERTVKGAEVGRREGAWDSGREGSGGISSQMSLGTKRRGHVDACVCV